MYLCIEINLIIVVVIQLVISAILCAIIMSG